jgi:glyoxylase-like metal-dependent hydrolase (beta-lactamase superfamily II)
MKHKAMLLGGIAAASLLSAAVWAQGMKGPAAPPAPRAFAQWDKVVISVEQKIGSNIAILHGNPGVDTSHPDASGGRVAVLYGPDGVLMVDVNNEEVHEKVLKTVRTLSNAPIKLLINSHAHPDHTGGNAYFARQGAVIMAQENLRDELLPNPNAGPRPAGAPAPAAVDPAMLPVVTYNYDPATKGKPAVTVHMNGETVDVIPMMPSHMGGDSIVKFEKANVIYIEDFYRNFGYPFADQGNGGSLKGMLDAIDLMNSVSNDQTLLIPGHGTLIHKKDLVPYRAMIVDLLGKTRKLIDAGKSLDEVLAANITKPYDGQNQGEDEASRKRFVTALYYESKGLPPVVKGRRAMPRPVPAAAPAMAGPALKKS